jgi:hypothetical protein
VELVLGVEAAQRSLEDLATPLTAQEEGEGGAEGADEDAERRTAPSEPVAARAAAPGRVTGRWTPRSGYSPFPVHSTYPWPSAASDVEVARIVAAVEDGPLDRNALYRRAGAERWGPGRFRLALHTAVARGLVVAAGRGHFRRAADQAAPPTAMR